MNEAGDGMCELYKFSEMFRGSGQSIRRYMTPVEEYLHHDVQLVSIPYRF